MTDRKLVDNVWSFLDRAGKEYGRLQEEHFRQEMHANCLDVGVQSPLEDLFWIAMVAMCKANYEAMNPTIEFVNGVAYWPPGVYVQPQARVGSYRVDFAVSRVPYLEVQKAASLAIELDGHDFHDKDKKQRAYEKSRDRFLVKEGYRVLHYTGSEVVSDPFRIAHEVLCLLNAATSPEFSPTDPLGLGE